MICSQCQEEKPNKDFYQSEICYKCTFKNKISLKKKSHDKTCKICKNIIPKENLIYWKACYCSEECAKMGKYHNNKNYWVHKCKSPQINAGFNYGKSK